jgi:Holliday junction resolvase RusA-like endonuclease
LTVTVTIPRPPSTNNLFIGVGKRRVRSSDYKLWATLAGWELNRQRPAKTAGKVSLTLEIQEPMNGRRQDLDNHVKSATDLLVTHGLIESDDQFTVRKIILQWSKDIEGARVTIEPWGSA